VFKQAGGHELGHNIVVQLSGGIGNQLFQYAAGKWLKRNREFNVTFEARLHSIEKAHGGFITDFALSEKVSTSRGTFSWNYLIASVKRIVRFRLLPFFPVGLRKRIKGQTFKGSLGFDPELSKLSNQKIVFGYFQTFVYAQDILLELKREIRLKESSSWLQKQVDIASDKRLVAIHIRRGDYVKFSESFGLLGIEYYSEALNELRERGHSWDEIWVFSDDIGQAKNLLKPIEGTFQLKYVEPPEGNNPLESLVLFGKAKFGVIANSTFSWWASFLSEDMEIVIAPDKWFRDKRDPDLLIPDSWVKARSFWEKPKQ
jgi:hypothetical protein